MGGLLLAPLYATGAIGAGVVKLQMAFGAWAGAIHGAWTGSLVVLVGCLAGLLLGGVSAWAWTRLRSRERLRTAPWLFPIAAFLCVAYIATLLAWHFWA